MWLGCPEPLFLQSPLGWNFPSTLILSGNIQLSNPKAFHISGLKQIYQCQLWPEAEERQVVADKERMILFGFISHGRYLSVWWNSKEQVMTRSGERKRCGDINAIVKNNSAPSTKAKMLKFSKITILSMLAAPYSQQPLCQNITIMKKLQPAGSAITRKSSPQSSATRRANWLHWRRVQAPPGAGKLNQALMYHTWGLKLNPIAEAGCRWPSPSLGSNKRTPILTILR